MDFVSQIEEDQTIIWQEVKLGYTIANFKLQTNAKNPNDWVLKFLGVGNLTKDFEESKSSR